MNCFGVDMEPNDLLILKANDGSSSKEYSVAAIALSGPGMIASEKSVELEVGVLANGLRVVVSAKDDVDLLATLSARAQIKNTCGQPSLITAANEVRLFPPQADSERPGFKGKVFSLKALQGAVGGTIATYGLSDGRVLVCNDDGHELGLPVNIIATMIWRNNQPYPCNHKVLGDVVLCYLVGDELT